VALLETETVWADRETPRLIGLIDTDDIGGAEMMIDTITTMLRCCTFPDRPSSIWPPGFCVEPLICCCMYSGRTDLPFHFADSTSR